MVKKSVQANIQIKTALLTVTAANPAWATAAPGEHDPSALPYTVAERALWQQAFGIV